MLCGGVIKDNSNYFNNFKIPTIIIAGDFSVSRLDSPKPFQIDVNSFVKSPNRSKRK